jgi:putative Mn2+ efflux pump MntP
MNLKQTIRHHEEKAKFWLAFTILSFIGLLILGAMSLQGCDSGDDEKKTNPKDVTECKKTVDVMEQCIGMEAMGTTVSEAKSECEKGNFDDFDRCLFKCEQSFSECDALTTCFDGC